MVGINEQWAAAGLGRRGFLRGSLAAGALIGAGGLLSACSAGGTAPNNSADASKIKKGGHLRVGATGGGAQDTLDAHLPQGGDQDQMRCANLYEPLAQRPPSFGPLEMLVASSIEPAGSASSWIVKIRDGIEFHNGKTVTAEDVIFSLRRILDPADKKMGAASLKAVDAQRLTAVDASTVRIELTAPNSAFPDLLCQYFNGIVPTDYDPKKPVGTGPFMYESFTPGQSSVFKRFPNYWDSAKPHVDQLTIIDFSDNAARVNALLGGQVDAISNLPTAQIGQVTGNAGLVVLSTPSGAWQPLVMNLDSAPFTDARVRKAFRLLVDRQQMIDQVLGGQGKIANDLYAPYDPAYANDLPQRVQDIDQAKSLLKQAGQSDLTVTLTTAPTFNGAVEVAQVFAQQAKAAGVNVQLQKVTPEVFSGDNYGKWTFTQDYWNTRMYLPQVAQSCLPDSPYNNTHWNNEQFTSLITQARAAIDDSKRNELLHAAQKMQYDEGGLIIPYFANQTDAFSAKIAGVEPQRSGMPLGNYWFKNVGFVD